MGQQLDKRSVFIIVACLIGMMIGEGPIVQKTFGLFIAPMSHDLGWSRGSLSFLAALAAWASVPLMPAVGWAVDRWGAEKILAPGFGLFAFATALSALSSSSQLRLVAIFLLIGATSAMTSVLIYATIISKHFWERRGFILGLTLGTGSALGATVMPLVAGALIAQFGWRLCRLGLTGVIIVAGAFVVLLLRLGRERGPAFRAAALAPKTPYDPTTLSIVRAPTLWMIVAAGSLTNTVFAGMSVHLAPFLTDRGIELADATNALAVFGFTHLLGQVTAGYMLDKVDRPQVALPFFIGALGGLLLVHFSSRTPIVLAGAFIMGWGHGAELSAGAYFFARYFGVSAFGSSYGVMVLFGSIGAGLGPLLMGEIFDAFGSYDPALWIFEAVLAVSVLIIACLGPYTYPPKGSA